MEGDRTGRGGGQGDRTGKRGEREGSRGEDFGDGAEGGRARTRKYACSRLRSSVRWGTGRLERRRSTAARARVRRHPDWRRATARARIYSLGAFAPAQRARARGAVAPATRASARSGPCSTRAGDRERAARPGHPFLPRGHTSRAGPFPSPRAIRAPATSTRRRVDGHSATVPGTAALSAPARSVPRARPRRPRSPARVPRRSPVRSLVASARARGGETPLRSRMTTT